MTLQELYDMAKDNDIQVMRFELHNMKAFCINDNGRKFIAIDYAKISSEQEEREILAEEIAHLKYDLLYKLSDYGKPNFFAEVQAIEEQARQRAAALLNSEMVQVA